MIRLLSLGLAMLAAIFAGSLFAQELPGTDIWLARISNGVPGEPVRINTGSGYNNQPHFSEDGSVIYYTREMSDGEVVQTDIVDFGTFGINLISRLAINLASNQIALVSNHLVSD